MEALPSGTVTFLFTDIVGSTRRWELQGELMAEVLARHDEILVAAVESARGRVVKHTGDGVLAVFASAGDAVASAVAGQRALATQVWSGEPVLVRMGLHSGEAVEAGGDYFGPALNRAARVMAAGWGGQILCTTATVELARDRVVEGIGFRSLGEHALRDLSQPFLVWQVTHSALGDTFPALRSLNAAVGNLPLQLSTFVGRRRELAQLAETLATVRVLTLCGVGGVGKTRLALEVAAEVHHDQPDGVWWCELAPIGDPDALVGVVAGVFGLVQEPGRPLLDTIAGYLASKQLLVVLDNCEHLLDAAAGLVDVLCRRCRGVRVLATSREPLGVDGEQTAAIRPLPESEAVELFVDRARSIESGFVAEDATREICRRLDGIPLALEMAAARLRSMQPPEIAARLNERFRLLIGGRRASERQQTLRATIAWSHDLLEERERRVFRRLAVFAGSFDLAAVEAVTVDDELDVFDVDDLLGSLTAKSLVNVERAGGGTTRFGLLETIRQFAQEHLDAAGESDERRRRHAEHYRSLITAAGEGLRGADEPIWADRVAAELDNLRAASGWAVASGDAALALSLFAPLPPNCLAEPVAHEILSWVDTALALPNASGDPNFWPALIWVHALGLYLFDFDQLPRRLQRVRTLPGWRDHPQIHILEGLVSQAIDGDMGAAAASYEQAAVGFAALGDIYLSVRCRTLGLFCRPPLGVDDTLLRELDANADRARQINSPYLTAMGVGAPSAHPSVVLHDPVRALRLIDEAATWAVRSRNTFMTRALANARVLALALLKDPAALAAARSAIEVTRNRTQVALQAGSISVALSLMGHHQEAAELIGSTMDAPLVYNTLRASPQITQAWERTRTALGDTAYNNALARGAARHFDQLADWLRSVLDRLTANDTDN